MPVTVKTPEQIEKMRDAGRLAAEVLEVVAEHDGHADVGGRNSCH